MLDGAPADVKAACEKVKDAQIPSQDYPAVAYAGKACEGPNGNGVYYNDPPDYVLARQCAFWEREKRLSAAVLQGSDILEMIYANGYGVAKNLNLALKFACEGDGAKSDDFARSVRHIQKMMAEKDPGELSVCDDQLSSLMMTICMNIHFEKYERERKSKIDSLIASWPPRHQEEFKRLQAAAFAYFKASAENETYHAGLSSGAMILDAENMLKDSFIREVVQLEAGDLPQMPVDFAKADKQLNKSYHKKISVDPSEDASGITRKDIQQTQRLWLAYRDAWIEFAALHYPKVAPGTLNAMLTEERTKRLDEIPTGD